MVYVHASKYYELGAPTSHVPVPKVQPKGCLALGTLGGGSLLSILTDYIYICIPFQIKELPCVMLMFATTCLYPKWELHFGMCKDEVGSPP